MRPLHVLHVIGGGDTGGAMSHLLPLLTALERLDCDVHLLCLGEGGLADEARGRGLPVEVVGMRNAWDPTALLPLRTALRRGPDGDGRRSWDIVHTHGMRANLPVRLALQVGSRRPCLFTTVHSDLLLDYAQPVLARTYRLLDQATSRRVDTIVCVSESLRTLLLERAYAPERLLVIRSGIEWPEAPITAPSGGTEAGVAAFGAATEAASGGVASTGAAGLGPATAAETAIGDGRTRPRIGTVARLVPVKDVSLLLEVAALLRRSVPDLECLIVGDGPERGRLEERARGLGLDEIVRFLGHVDDIRPLLANLDLLVVTSVFEGGVSMTVLEAMAAGLPVLTTAAGGVAEAVKDGETGFVLARDRERGALAAALAERAAALLADEALRSRMGRAGARRVRELFLVERMAERTLRAYERCLAGRGEPA